MQTERIIDTIKKLNLSNQGQLSVNDWDPPFCGDIDIQIKRDGSWHYMGTPIGREALVRLFARVLRKDEEDYYLVTPVEKVRIQVVDVPFVVTDFEIKGKGKHQVLIFTTSIGDIIALDALNKFNLVIHDVTLEPSPYLWVRDRLWALMHRNVFYRLVDISEANSSIANNSKLNANGIADISKEESYGFWSAECFYPLC